jgi:hypothetical protein
MDAAYGRARRYLSDEFYLAGGLIGALADGMLESMMRTMIGVARRA